MNRQDPGAAQAVWEQGYRSRGRIYGREPRKLPDLASGARVLEAGCGDGKTLSAMSSRGWSIHALDFCRSALELCRSNPRIGEVEYLQADAAALPFRDETFDAVFLTHIAGHAGEPDRGRIAAESVRVLRSGGRLFFRGFSTSDFRVATGTGAGPSTRITAEGILTHYFTTDEVIRLFLPLTPIRVAEERWFLKIRGRILPRGEIAGEFLRE